ncbi:type VI secretion system membrane subunit TssM [Pseudomonas syringae]|uniref:type VI secretion system membrane subunit TssM n=1 Tax=Pseudomonas syringae TaxID=317 RepID=UPI001F2CAFA0|nr:type VI secretion system membrane subunit TssM [Pseudomonas syringae]MCF5709541.1 type VI secretion system membrane subunit TssM [Pseudomonas syringae]
MKTLFKPLSSLLRKTWFWSLLLVLGMICLIWLFGPLLAVADYRFWESAVSRLVAVSMLLLLWGLTMVFVSWQAGARHKREENSEAGKERLQQSIAIDQERQEVAGRFKDALRRVKRSTLYDSQKQSWRQELPWFLLIGPEGSGKTSLLDFSGLDFPFNKVERKLTRDTKSTACCDWYLTDQAVIMDTAGRYLSQTRSEIDGSAWSHLLSLLRERRRSRPLNGVLIALPVDTLLDRQPHRLESLAESVRGRLDEVRRQLRIEVPVYLVLTKADAIEGFDEFFEQLSREESRQVLGSTFSKEQRGSDIDVVGKAFSALLKRLSSQMITRLHQERDVQRRGRMLEFPDQLGRIGQGLNIFVEMAFSGNRYQRASHLRGFYLTRAPHLTDPQAADEKDAGHENIGLPLRHVGRPRFIHDLLTRVIFAESDLAVLNKDERRSFDWRRRLMYGSAALLVAVFGVLWVVGFSANHDRLETLRITAQQWGKQRLQLTSQDDALAVLDALNTHYRATQVFPEGSELALYERTGLYQGRKVNQALLASYHAELQRWLLPRVAHMLEAQMHAGTKDREQLLDSLRAYLMLTRQARRDQVWLKERIAADWSIRYAGHAEGQRQLNQHLQRLLEIQFDYPGNESLVAQTRQILRTESLANVVYHVLRDKARSLPDYSLSRRIDPQKRLLTGTDHRIPGFYTREGYQHYFLTQGAGVVSDILRDNWVLGDSAEQSTADMRRLMVELEQLYFRDYANHWSEILGQTSLQPFEGPRQGALQMAGLTAANSPLVQLLIEVRENTRFPTLVLHAGPVEAPNDAATPSATLGTVASAVGGQVQPSLSNSLPDAAKRALQRRFDPLHRLLDKENAPGLELVALFNALDEVQVQMATLDRAGQPDLAAYEMARGRMGGQRDALSGLRTTAAQLPQPLAGWLNRMAEDTWSFVLHQSYRHVNQRYKDELYSFYVSALDKRYPFHAHSSSDVALDDFREFFKSQGVAERFFDRYLKPFVSGEPGHFRLRSIDGYSLPMSRTYLDQMGGVHAIRKRFFAGPDQELLVQFKLEPHTLDSTVSRAEFRLGDQSMVYRHGPIVPVAFTWPTEIEDGRASLVLDRMTGRPIGIEKNTGPWSLFRLLDLMQTEPLKGRDVHVLKADVGGMRANYLLLSQRAANPFDMSVLRGLRMPAQL